MHLFPAQAAGNSLGQNLALLLSLGEGGGSIVRSADGHNIGTYHGTPAWRTSPFGLAAGLDGSTNWIEVPADPTINSIPIGGAAGIFSIATWVNWHSSSEAYGLLYGEEDGGGFNFAVFIKSDGSLAVYFQSGNVDPIPSFTLGADKWHLFVLTNGMDAGTRLYVDGVRIYQGNNFGSFTAGNSARRVRIGGNSIFGSGRWINGAIGPVAKWFRQLNDAEALLLYQRPESLFAPHRQTKVVQITGAAGSINLSGIPSDEALGSIQLTAGNVDISLPGIATGEALGAISVLPRQNLALPGIATAEALGAIEIATSQGMQLPTIIGGEALGILKLQGGLIATKIFIGGVDRSNYLAAGDARVAQQTTGRWTATFSLRVNDGNWAPSLGQTVQIQDFGRRSFAGCIDEIVVDRLLSSVSKIVFRCSALDKTFICDHRVVTQRLYPAGTDVCDIFRDIAAEFLIGEGITVGVLPATLDVIDSDLPLNYESVTSAFDKATQLAGANWWVDVFSQLQLRKISGADACPFQVTESSKNWRALTVKYSLKDFTNSVYVRSNLSTLPAQNGVPFSYIVNQPEAAARGFVQGACIFPENVATIISLKVNGVLKQVFSGTDPETYDVTNPLYGHTWWMFYGTPYLNPPGSATSVPSPPEKPALGDLVEIVYVPVVQSTQVVKAVTPFAPTAMPGITLGPNESLGTCGSGIYDSVQQVNDIILTSDLQAIADSIIARFGAPLRVIDFETDVPGAAVGQKLHVDLPRVYLPSQDLLITAVDGISMKVDLLRTRPDLRWDGLGSSFRWRISAATADVGNWVKWFERLLRRTEHPNPVVREQLITFIIAPGGSVVSGTVDTNPKRVTQSCKLTEGNAVAGVPPVDQDLYLNILSARLGGGKVFKNDIVIPAGSTSLHSSFAFFADPAYLFKNDILLATARYVVTGANPVPASSVSLDVVGVW